MEQTGVDEVTNMEKDASRLWFTSLVSGATVCIDKIVMVIALTRVPHRVVGNNLLPADPAGYADNLWPDTVGFQPAAEMGRRLGEVDDKVSHSPFLRSDAPTS